MGYIVVYGLHSRLCTSVIYGLQSGVWTSVIFGLQSFLWTMEWPMYYGVVYGLQSGLLASGWCMTQIGMRDTKTSYCSRK